MLCKSAGIAFAGIGIATIRSNAQVAMHESKQAIIGIGISAMRRCRQEQHVAGIVRRQTLQQVIALLLSTLTANTGMGFIYDY